jgi:hypothetical protein
MQTMMTITENAVETIRNEFNFSIDKFPLSEVLTR